jgi:hypothetical protein
LYKNLKIRILLLLPILLALLFSYTPANSIQDPPFYYPSGPQQNIDKSVVESGGWALCWSGTYGGTDLLSNITTSCDLDYILYAGGLTDNSNLMLLAAGKREMVFTIQPNMSNQTLLENGSYWYFNTGMGSMGFAPNSTIQQTSADTYAAWGGNLDDGSLRLSWHTGHCGAENICGGWRVGTIVGLNGSNQYTRYIYESTGGATPSPTPTPTETSSPSPTPVEPSPTSSPTQTPTESPSPTPSPEPTQTQNPVDPNPNPEPDEPEPVVPSTEPTPEETLEPELEPEPSFSPEPTPIEEPIDIVAEQEQLQQEALQEYNPDYEYQLDEVIPASDILEELNEEETLAFLEELDPNQPIEYVEGVIIEAGVAVIFEQLDNPAALLAEAFDNPGQVLEALGQLGADMTEQQREDSQQVVVASVIVSQVLGAMTLTTTPPAPAPSSGGSGGGGGGGGSGDGEKKPKPKGRKKPQKIKHHRRIK